MGTVRARGQRFLLDYYDARGRRHRDTVQAPTRKDAERVLKQREGDLAHGRVLYTPADRVLFDDLAADFIRDYQVNGKRSLWKAEKSVERLTQFFGGWRAVNITTQQVRAYIVQRQKAGLANGTINRELAALKRAFRLAVKAKVLSHDHVPDITLLKEASPRRGFFERAQFEAVRRHLPAALKPLVTVAYITGWRMRSEILPMRWRQVDLEADTMRLDPGTTKNDDGRLFVMTPELKATLAAQWAETDALQRETGQIIPFVFHRKGKPIKSFRRAWLLACEQAGVPGRIPHDFRRTAVRNLERAGIARSVAMKMVGHKTESIYRRYAIVSEGDLREAAKKLAAIDRGTWNGDGSGSHPVHEPKDVQNTLAQHQVAGGPRRRSTDGGTRQ
jgi:integrase